MIEPVPVEIHVISCHGQKVKAVPLVQSSQANPVLRVEGRLGQVLDGGGRVREIKLKLGRFLFKKSIVTEVSSGKGYTFGLIKVSFSQVTRTKLSSFKRFSFSRGFFTSLWLLMTARYLEYFLKSSPRIGSCQY